MKKEGIENMLRKKIVTNKIRCNNCGQVIESKHRHDFVTCECGAVSVDGGKEYLKRTFKKSDSYEDLSEVVEV
jgi:Zn finger protein HypA/HybF involved in hydrogenase expression